MSILPHKNDEFRVSVTDLSEEGLGIGRHEGFTFFIKGAVPGDEVAAHVTKVLKSYGFARAMSVVCPSPDRIEPACGVADRCGGCQLMRMSYEAELRWKEEKVLAALRRIGGLDLAGVVTEPIIGADSPHRYRNKAIYPIGRSRDGRIVSGFFALRSHDIVECSDCLLEPVEFHDILTGVTGWMEEEGIEPFDEADGSGAVRHVMIRKAFQTGEIMVVIVAARKLSHEVLGRLVSSLKARPEKIASIGVCLNRARGNAVLNGEIFDLFGPGYIEDILLGERFRISARSFYQVDPIQTERLYSTAISYAELTGEERVLDLYSGIGTISLIAARHARSVCGIEVVEEAVKDAEINASINEIDNVSFVTGKVEDILPAAARGAGEFRKIFGAPRSGYALGDAHPPTRHVASDIPAPGAQGHSFDTVFLDPPRKGAEESVLSAIADAAPERIIYISCNPASLARDLRFLTTCGYRLTRVRPVDMFPRTTHVETVVLMSRVGV